MKYSTQIILAIALATNTAAVMIEDQLNKILADGVESKQDIVFAQKEHDMQLAQATGRCRKEPGIEFEIDDGICYPKCKDGFYGVGP